jgi:ABC-type amino acid transport substrate-binding protein
MLKVLFVLTLFIFPATAEVVLTKTSAPFAMKDDSGRWIGVSIELWEKVAEEAGIKSDYSETDLEGILNGLSSQKAVAGVAALSMTPEREQRLDFSHSYFTTKMGLALPQKSSGWWSAISPFFSIEFMQALAALAFVLLVFGALVWFFERKKNPEQFGGSFVEGVGSGFWWSAVTMTTVGYGDKAPLTAMGRMVGMVWMFAGLIVVSGFTAAITTSLTVNQIDQKVRDLSDLQGKQIAVLEGSTSESYLNQLGMKTKAVKQIKAAFDLLGKHRVDAIAHDLPVLRYLSKDLHLDLISLEEAPVQHYAFALPTDSVHREAINTSILKKLANGEFQKILNRYLEAL